MQIYLDCIPCLFNLAFRISKMVTEDENKIKRVLDEVGMIIKDIHLNSKPPEIGKIIYQKVSEIVGEEEVEIFWRKIKAKNIETAKKLYHKFKNIVKDSKDSLLTSIKVAIGGNVIDYAINKKFNVEEEIERSIKNEFAIFDYDEFKRQIEITDEVLFIGDNAGESVFDKLLIEEIKKHTKYVVRSKTVINDVTYEDAIKSGIDEVAEIIPAGTDAPGLLLSTCSEYFLEIYRNAKMIISKGQGNYEALSEEHRPIFFLLRTKCQVIASDLGVRDGDMILKMSKNL